MRGKPGVHRTWRNYLQILHYAILYKGPECLRILVYGQGLVPELPETQRENGTVLRGLQRAVSRVDVGLSDT